MMGLTPTPRINAYTIFWLISFRNFYSGGLHFIPLTPLHVFPAKAGIQVPLVPDVRVAWIPAQGGNDMEGRFCMLELSLP
jgi:hypothetical protein